MPDPWRERLAKLDAEYEADRDLRVLAWRERTNWCRCTRPVPDRSYLRQRVCATCDGWIK